MELIKESEHLSIMQNYLDRWVKGKYQKTFDLLGKRVARSLPEIIRKKHDGKEVSVSFKIITTVRRTDE